MPKTSKKTTKQIPFGILDDRDEDVETIELAVVLDPIDRERVLSRDFLFPLSRDVSRDFEGSFGSETAAAVMISGVTGGVTARGTWRHIS